MSYWQPHFEHGTLPLSPLQLCWTCPQCLTVCHGYTEPPQAAPKQAFEQTVPPSMLMPLSQQFSFSQSVVYWSLGTHPSHQFMHFCPRHVVSGIPDGSMHPAGIGMVAKYW
jgi:hypothetical protein